MAWWEREYYSHQSLDDAAEPQRFRWRPVATSSLIIAHAVAFIAVLIARQTNADWSFLALNNTLTPPWAVFTHPFALGSTGSAFAAFVGAVIVFASLWFLADVLERRLGAQLLIRSYIAGFIAGGVGYYAGASIIGENWAPLTYPIGAISAWVVLAFRQLRYDMVLVFGRLTNVGMLTAIIAAVIVFLHVMFAGAASAGWLAAIFVGGASAFTSEQFPNIHFRRSTKIVNSNPRSASQAVTSMELKEDDEPDIDDILDKIHRLGMNSLTNQELERLEEARRAKLSK